MLHPNVREALALAQEADNLGFTHVRIVEHYFHYYGGYSPNPMVFLAAAAQRTPCGQQVATPPADAFKGALTHDNQTEGYYIVSGGGTAFIDGTLINGRHSDSNPDGGPNGPGCGGLSTGSRKVELKVGDVLIVPPGVVHGWADIPDHVDYLSFRPSHNVMKNGWVNPAIASN